jgi:4-hydroxy-2-oxoheptanedioate aldolase
MTANEYLEKADFWPLNPNGELILGLKLEDRQSLENSEVTTKVPGVGFAEYGPGDMTFSLVGIRPPGRNYGQAPEVAQARLRIIAACKAAGIFFMDSGANVSNVAEKIEQGAMISRANQETAEKARQITKREMPW